MKRYRYIEIAPSRSAYDPIYLTFENIKTKEIIYRKALRWDLKKMKTYAMTIIFEDGTVDLFKVKHNVSVMKVVPIEGNTIITYDFSTACETKDELIEEIRKEFKHASYITMKEMNS